MPLTFLDLFHGRLPRLDAISRLEAVSAADRQVLAAQAPGDLDALAAFPAVESVVAMVAVRATCSLPSIRELLHCAGYLPDRATLRRLTGIESLAAPSVCDTKLNLEDLPAGQMRELAFSRWRTESLEPLANMKGLRALSADLFKDPVDAIGGMEGLRHLRVKGPAKGWSKLGACTQLEEAIFVDVQMANLRRWASWTRLHTLGLYGRGVKSLDGIQAMQAIAQLTLVNQKMDDLALLRELPRLESLTLRMPAGRIDLESIGAIPALRSLTLDESVITDRDVIHLPSLQPLARAARLKELVLRGVALEDGSLRVLADLPSVRNVVLGQDIDADAVAALRAARPNLAIEYTPPEPRDPALEEKIGGVTIHRASRELAQWWIFENLADGLGVSTNYAAESKIHAAIKTRDAALVKRLKFDTEAGAVGIYATSEADIRAVAEVVNSLLA